MAIHITGNAAADELLTNNPFALVAGMMLDQQYPMEHAFQGPAKLADRMGGRLDLREVADAEPAEFAALCAQTPAVHRFPGAMAARLQALAQHLLAEYDGDVTKLWREADDGADLFRRVTKLPGFGKQKAAIFVALLGKQLGVRPPGWENAAGDYAEDGFRSVADVVDPGSLQKVRDFKKQKKAAAKSAERAT